MVPTMKFPIYGKIELMFQTTKQLQCFIVTCIVTLVQDGSSIGFCTSLDQAPEKASLAVTESLGKNGDLLLLNGTSKCDLMDYEWDIASGND